MLNGDISRIGVFSFFKKSGRKKKREKEEINKIKIQENSIIHAMYFIYVRVYFWNYDFQNNIEQDE